MLTLWLDGVHGARENMRRDEALLRRAERGGVAVLRVYGFAPAGITLGYAQSAERELDLEVCRRDGVAWAVRPTGGRALFHGGEWTYALASPVADPEWGGTLREAYARARAPVAAALRRLGIPAEPAPGARGRGAAVAEGPGITAEGDGSPARPCFASASSHEIVAVGRKLVGSAQRRTAGGLIQQGCVLTGDDHLRIVDYLRLPAAQRARWREQLQQRAARPSAWFRHLTLADFAEALHAVTEASAWLKGDEGLNALTLAKDAPYTAASGPSTSCVDSIERSAV